MILSKSFISLRYKGELTDERDLSNDKNRDSTILVQVMMLLKPVFVSLSKQHLLHWSVLLGDSEWN